jgi:hypothetical protein
VDLRAKSRQGGRQYVGAAPQALRLTRGLNAAANTGLPVQSPAGLGSLSPALLPAPATSGSALTARRRLGCGA